VAESYGGRDEPLDSLVSGLVSAGVEPLMDLRVKDDPSEAVYQVRWTGGREGRGWGRGCVVCYMATACVSFKVRCCEGWRFRGSQVYRVRGGVVGVGGVG